MNILVTGGAGYIGSHFCQVAQAAGHTPVVLDNLSTGHRKFVQFGPLVEADIRDTDTVEKALKDHQIKAVVHFAAKSLVGESMQKPEEYYANNVSGTISLLKAMLSVQIKTIVFSSSAATYGIAEDDLIFENSRQKPINPYGRTKLQCEEILLDFEKLHGFKVACLRYFNVVGQDPEGRLFEDHTPETHLIPNILKALREGRDFSLFGKQYPTPDGTNVRDYVDVRDLGLAHLAALKAIETRSLLVSNVARGKGYSVLEVFEAFRKVFGQAPRLVEAPPRAGDPPQLVADATFFKSWYQGELKTIEESLQSLKTPAI